MMEEECEVIFYLGQVLRKLGSKLSSDRTLLRLQEAFKEHTDSDVYILLVHIVSQVHLGVSF